MNLFDKQEYSKPLSSGEYQFSLTKDVENVDAYHINGLESFIESTHIGTTHPFFQALISLAYIRRFPIAYDHKLVDYSFYWEVDVFTPDGGFFFRGTNENIFPKLSLILGNQAVNVFAEITETDLPESVPYIDWTEMIKQSRSLKKDDWNTKIVTMYKHPLLKKLIQEYRNPYTITMDGVSSLIWP